MIHFLCIKKGLYNDQQALGDQGEDAAIRDLLLKAKNEDGHFDFSLFKKLYSQMYINGEIKMSSRKLDDIAEEGFITEGAQDAQGRNESISLRGLGFNKSSMNSQN
jgi:hypothetical protein